jgi:LmbE family N-acetylglucosaminyl deacetylase
MKKITIIVPHGDDEVLGFGGSINKHRRQGDQVDVIFTKAPYDSRSILQTTNITAASDILDYKVHSLNISLEHSSSFTIETLNSIETILIKLKPDILYVPHPEDTHQDHLLIFQMVKIATRINGPAPVPTILCGEIISSTEMSIKSRFNPNYYNSLEAEELIQKQKAMKVYSQEIRKYPHARSLEGIEIYARKRGLEISSVYAEAFECLRHINF